MLLEKALRYELNKINEISGKIFPTNAPQGKKPPYLVYVSESTPLKDLNGTKENIDSYVLLNILCESYSEMKDVTRKVRKLINTFPFRSIGENGPYIEDLTAETTAETYENELELYRGIIPFKISYLEE